MNSLKITDVRSAMPNYATYANTATSRAITGVAIHHSARVHLLVGISGDNALAIFNYHVQRRAWNHGAYHYFVHPSGMVEYALDEEIPGHHAGINDPGDQLGLEEGQYWNNRYLAVCLLGWFEADRQIELPDGNIHKIPNRFTRPTAPQMQALIELIRQLRRSHEIPLENVRGHRELAGCTTRCPGANVDMDALRRQLQK